jgi:REP element-mobilizing transposase RayT
MPRAHRHFLPHHVWHITHRCHRQEFLLKFAKDRQRWRYWLFQARKRFGLCVLNYIVTSNHIHLLVRDYREIQQPPQRYAVIDRLALCDLLGIHNENGLREHHAGWIETAVASEDYLHEPCWTQSLAVGDREFLQAVRTTLGSRGHYRDIEEQHGMLALREPATAYRADFGEEWPL